MSLFKARDFWTTICDSNEQFDQSSLKKSKFGGDDDYIITGSHSGVLRVFKPSSEVQDDGKVTGFKATDLVIEKSLPQPILQVADGRLISGSSQVQLAVLHPKVVSVFALSSKSGATEHGTQHSLQLLYEHKLRRSAFNFLIGPFGGSSNRDFLCVQSLDGLLSFFEQESFSFCCFLPDFLIPGPICYLFRADVFVTAGSDWILRAYRYRKLSEAGQNSNQEDATGKKAESCWELNVGENVVDLKVAKHVSGKETLVALGERNFYGISEGGKVLFMKHLEYSPICFSCFVLGEDEKIMTMIVSETSTLLIYQGTSLKWSANLSILPVCIERVFLKHIKGAIVGLSEEGQLNCSYLGTQPSVFVAPPLNNQINFEKAISDLENYNKFIRENSLEENSLIAGAKLERDLTVSVRVNEELQKHVLESEQEVDACEIIVEMTPLANLEEVQLIVCVEESFVVVPELSSYSTLVEKELARFLVYCKKDNNVNSLQIDVIITFTTNAGIPKVSQQAVRLPFKFVAETCSPQKEAAHKIVLCMNRPSVPLNTIFSEFSADQLTNNSAAFVANAAKPVTILLAKTSERYRVQSDSMLSLNIVVEELVDRLMNYYHKTSEFAITFSSSLPIPQFLEYVNQHFTARQELVILEREIVFLSAQYRIIQKRLISKFKAKHPTPLTNLEIVLGDTLDLIMSATANLENAKQRLQNAQTNLSCILCLILNLVQNMDMKRDVLKTLQGAFCPSVKDIEGQSWEDTMDASACFLLRTVLAKTEKDKLRAPHTSFEEIKDIGKVEKHITQVLERVAKKGALLETHFPAEEEATNVAEEATNTSHFVEKVPEKEMGTVPIGSQIGQASSRILSAKTNLLQKRHRLQQHQQEEESLQDRN